VVVSSLVIVVAPVVSAVVSSVAEPWLAVPGVPPLGSEGFVVGVAVVVGVPSVAPPPVPIDATPVPLSVLGSEAVSRPPSLQAVANTHVPVRSRWSLVVMVTLA